MAGKMCSKLCGALGFKILELRPDGEKLEQRLKVSTEENGKKSEEPRPKANMGNSKKKKNDKKNHRKMAIRKHKINDMYNCSEKYLMGQNVIKSNIPDLVDTLLKRDVPKIYHWDGKKLLGPTFVPPGFVPKYPKIIDHNNIENLKEKSKQMLLDGEISEKEEANLIKEQEKAIGDMAEREVFDVLQDFCKTMPGTFLIIKDLDMINVDPEKRIKKGGREIDFLVIDGTHGTIMNIEVKNHLTDFKKELEDESSIDKVKRQVEENKEFLEDWLGADISETWQFISMVYTLKLGDNIRSCDDCKLFIACGKDELFIYL